MKISTRVFWAAVLITCACIMAPRSGSQQNLKDDDFVVRQFKNKTVFIDSLVVKNISVRGEGEGGIIMGAGEGHASIYMNSGKASVQMSVHPGDPQIEFWRGGKTQQLKKITLDNGKENQ